MNQRLPSPESVIESRSCMWATCSKTILPRHVLARYPEEMWKLYFCNRGHALMFAYIQAEHMEIDE